MKTSEIKISDLLCLLLTTGYGDIRQPSRNEKIIILIIQIITLFLFSSALIKISNHITITETQPKTEINLPEVWK